MGLMWETRACGRDRFMWVGQDAGPIYNLTGNITKPTAQLDFEVPLPLLRGTGCADSSCKACASMTASLASWRL